MKVKHKNGNNQIRRWSKQLLLQVTVTSSAVTSRMDIAGFMPGDSRAGVTCKRL
jgi:hypothetical protein